MIDLILFSDDGKLIHASLFQAYKKWQEMARL